MTMGKITWSRKLSTPVVVDLNDPEVRNRLRREAENAARMDQRRKMARRKTVASAR